MGIIQFIYSSVSALVDLAFTLVGALVYGILKGVEWIAGLAIGDVSNGSNVKMIVLVLLSFAVISMILWFAFKFSFWVLVLFSFVVPASVVLIKIGLSIWVGLLLFKLLKKIMSTFGNRITN
ncbi:hypothetical protein [Carnobacterium maltaromaticum]|uniref:hypothetical protein n=1 Tax=Carnobacterium maltaromaticum TaxID=2751 RepID=UPI00191BABB7|nr:hypothetical protein [Carnobacterium maltaromaticum]CAD5903043.1 membrane hypothetical protein [Carnobacterium maltaromaticum]